MDVERTLSNDEDGRLDGNTGPRTMSDAGSYVVVHASASSYFPSPAVLSPALTASIAGSRTNARAANLSLFHDLLVSSAFPEDEQKPESYWPPRDDNALLETLEKWPDGKEKDQITYLWLLAFREDGQGDDEAAMRFAADRLIPPGYMTSLTALHLLDIGQYGQAIHSLTSPLSPPPFPSAVLRTLSALSPIEDTSRLVLAFFRLAALDLAAISQSEDDEAELMQVVLTALCDPVGNTAQTNSSTSTAGGRKAIEAWKWAWKAPTLDKQQQYATMVLASCFGANPHQKPNAPALRALLAHPLTPSASDLLTSFCLAPPASLATSTLIPDFRISKYLADSDQIGCLRFARALKRQPAAVGGRGDTKERRALLNGAWETLSRTGKARVELEIEQEAGTGRKPAAAGAEDEIEEDDQSEKEDTLAQPAWVPALPKPDRAPPTSLLSLAAPASPGGRAGARAASPLPLSASPFFRASGSAVDAHSASPVGGAQRGVLWAMGAASAAAAPAAGGSASASAQGGSTTASRAPPTLNGFGTAFERGTPTSWRARTGTPGSGTSAAGAGGRLSSLFGGAAAPAQEEEQEHEHEDTFARRAAMDPTVKGVLAKSSPGSAPVQRQQQPARAKGRQLALSSSEEEDEDDGGRRPPEGKRRAISNEPDDGRPQVPASRRGGRGGRKSTAPARAPSAASTAGKGRAKPTRRASTVPGGFDAAFSSDEEDELPPVTEGEVQARTPARRGRGGKASAAGGAGTRRKKTATSAEEDDEPEVGKKKATGRKAAKKVEESNEALNTPRVRRSTRLTSATPGR